MIRLQKIATVLGCGTIGAYAGSLTGVMGCRDLRELEDALAAVINGTAIGAAAGVAVGVVIVG